MLLSELMIIHLGTQIKQNGTYVAVTPIEATKVLLEEWLAEQPFVRTKRDLHCTVIYSKSPVKVDVDDTEYICQPKSFDIFEDGTNKVLVLKLEAPSLFEWNKKLMLLGATSDYPKYQPHITLGDGDGVNLKDLKLPNFGLILGNAYTEELEP